MKVLKIVLFIILGIVGLALIIPAFTKKDYAVVREVTINKPEAEVYSYIKLLKNQDNFSVWATKDPNMKKEFRGTDGTVGFVSAWDSEMDEVGKGEQEIIGITEGERVDYELRFMEPFEAKDNAYMTTEAVGENQTKVTWGFKGKMDYPMNIMMVFMDMEDMLGGDLQKGLDNLKGVMEQ